MAEPSIFSSNPLPLAFRISYLANFFTEVVYRQVMEEHGIARSGFVVIFCLRSLTGEISAQDICALTGRPKNSVSRAVNAMVERGYVARRVDPQDARRAFLTLTRRGEAMYEAVLPRFVAREREMFEPLNDRDRKALVRILDKLIVRRDFWTE